MTLKVDKYRCIKCLTTKMFHSEKNELEHKCPNCNSEMGFLCSEEIDSETGQVIQNQKETVTEISTITCPYCKSTNIEEISALSKAWSVTAFGIFALGKTTKQFHCNNCGADFWFDFWFKMIQYFYETIKRKVTLMNWITFICDEKCGYKQKP